VASAGQLLREAAQGHLGVDRRLVQSILDGGAEAVREVLAFARASHEQDRMDLDPLLVDLVRHWQVSSNTTSSEALDFLIEAIRRSADDVPDELVQALLPFGEHAVAPLLKLHEELGEEQGSDIAFLLAGLRVHDPRVLALLLDRLQFDARDGALCLELYHDPAARPALEAMLAEIPAEDAELRRDLQHALDELDQPAPAYEPLPFDILAEYPARELPAFEVLREGERLQLLESPDAETRAGAAHSFFNHELDPRTRAALFKLAQSDPDAKVRGRAWESLADATEDAAILNAMLGVLNDTSRDIAERGGAAVGLYAVADRDDVSRALEALYAEDGVVARAKALDSMWRSLWKPYARFFPQHLEDPSKEIVRQALRGAGYFQLTGHTDKIASYFDREGDLEDLREDALFAYALAMPGETTRGRIRGMLRRIDALANLSSSEAELVMFALDERLRLAGLDPVFAGEEPTEHEKEAEHVTPAAPAPAGKVGRNDPCPCGSGKKYKKCHGA
jgi:SEC-C motif